jgi:hypothetical protein
MPVATMTEIIRSSGWELSNGNNLNLDCRGSVTCGLGHNIFLSGTKEVAQSIKKKASEARSAITPSLVAGEQLGPRSVPARPRNRRRRAPARWRPSPQSSYPIPRLTRVAGSCAQAWPDHSARHQRVKFRVRAVRGPISPKQDTLGDWGDDDASAPLLVFIGINLAPAEFKQGDVSTPKGSFP